MEHIGALIREMIAYNAGDPRRIHHFLKVYGFAKAIGELEGLDPSTQHILEIAALTHDIGIRNSERKYGSAAGSHQEVEGPPEAEIMLKALGVDPAIIERVCWLIAHHHTYTDISGMDYQILVEADFLVNALEEKLHREAIRSVERKLFRTAGGVLFLNQLYLQGNPH